MKIIDLLQLKSVWCALLILSLTVTFSLGKYSETEPSERVLEKSAQQEPTEPAREQVVGDGKNSFDQQCQELLYEMQRCMIPFFQPAADEDEVSSDEEEASVDRQRKTDKPRSIVHLRPLRKKRAIKQRSKLTKKSVQMDYSGLVGGDDQTDSPGGGLLPAVQKTVASLEARSILYGVGPLSDCSGILHRVLMGVKKNCPDYEYPTPEHDRDSRDLARWYHERGELIIIKNALAQAELIRPGVVLFYGRTGVVYKNPSLNTLLSPRHGIYHVGIVARVYRDSAGKVVRYELFHGHGRRGRTKASVTKWHHRIPTRASYPAFGNGRQQLVAAARIAGPVKKGGVKKLGGQKAGRR